VVLGIAPLSTAIALANTPAAAVRAVIAVTATVAPAARHTRS